MAEIKRATLFGKLTALNYRCMESATVFCKLRGNPFIEITHWLQQLLQLPDSDLHHIVKKFDLNPSRLAADLTASLDSLPRGHTSIMDFSTVLEQSLERAWVYSTLMLGDRRIRTGHIIVGLGKTPALKNVLQNVSGEFIKIKMEELSDKFSEIVAGSPEDAMGPQDGSGFGADVAPGETSGAVAPAAMGKQEALKRYSVDLTERARKGEMDPIRGRDVEIRQVMDILMRRRQNNPILTGEAGVGKTAVVEGFAQRIAAGDVPPSMQNVCLRTLDIGLLQAGASMKGEFENRLRQVIDEVQASAQPIILFIDEAHTLIGAGGAAGTGDAANLLKPALARGTLRTIAATTWAEYKKHIEKDPALTRRFQVVKVEEPDEHNATLMMRALSAVQEKHHKVPILDEALEAAVKFSHRYIPDRQLPDKAVSLLDTACARVAISQNATPAELEDCTKQIDALKIELTILEKEIAIGVDHSERLAEVTAEIKTQEERKAGLEKRWNDEKALVTKILDTQGKLRQAATAEKTAGAAPDPQLNAAAREGLASLQKELRELQGEKPLIHPAVDSQAVATVVADWTGIPVGRMVKNEIETVLKLADLMESRVIGQRHALNIISDRIRTSRAALDNPGRPIGVFMLVGPSGVGKTETALTLAEALYGGEQNVITINMSEFQEAHTVSTLKGAPPGYVGYGEGGVLTEAVRRRPYSVVLLDEVEKAHHDVHEIFFQVFDKGFMEDGEGRYISFKNTIILLTSNTGTDLIMNLCKDPTLLPSPDKLADAMKDSLLKVFPAALLGRLAVVPYYPISDEVLRKIIVLQLKRIGKRLWENHRIELVSGDDLINLVASRCNDAQSGARTVDAILTRNLLPAISREILTRLVEGKEMKKVHVGIKDATFDFAFE